MLVFDFNIQRSDPMKMMLSLVTEASLILTFKNLLVQTQSAKEILLLKKYCYSRNTNFFFDVRILKVWWKQLKL